MWVISQNAMKVVDVNDLEIVNDSLDNDDPFVKDRTKWRINDLAEYSSLEKCEKVLDMFVKSLILKTTYFKMPKEEDV